MPLSVILAWARQLARLIALGLGVYVCFVVLAMFALPVEPDGIRLDPVRVKGGVVLLSGQARPHAGIEVFAGVRLLTVSGADWRGRFVTAFEMPPDAYRVRVRASAPPRRPGFEPGDSSNSLGNFLGDSPVDTKIVSIRDPAAPVSSRIALAYLVEETRTLWIAGYGPPEASLRLDTADSAAGKPIGTIKADGTGCFDLLIPIPPEQPLPVSLFVRPAEQLQPSGEAAFEVARVPADGLPLSRTADIQIGDQEVRGTLRVKLPMAHPSFALLEKGLLTAEEFGRATFGNLSVGELQTKVASMRKQDAEGIVDLEVAATTPGLKIFSWYADYAGDGIGRYPLLTRKDQISVHLQGIESAWFGVSPTSLVADKVAVWQGPSDSSRRDGKVLEVGLGT